MLKNEYVQKRIEEMNLNAKSFAQKADIPYTTFRSMMERNFSGASIDNVIKMCRKLGISIDWFYNLEDEKEPSKEDSNKNVSLLAAHMADAEKKLSEEDIKNISDYIDFIISKKTSEE